jgi:hypothetical protein
VKAAGEANLRHRMEIEPSLFGSAKLMKYTLSIYGFDRAEMKSWMFDLFG